MRAGTPLTHLLLAITLLTVGLLLFTANADAKITRVQITTHESPTFGGYSWPGVGQTDSRLAPCEATHTCPVAVEIYSANEFWVKAGSLMTTTPDGTTDLPGSPYARNYFISSHQHGVGGATSKGNCRSSPRCSSRWMPGSTSRCRRPRAYRGWPTGRWYRRCRRRGWASRTFRASPTPV